MNRMIEFGCPVCREKLEIGQRSAGKEKLCPACNAPVKVPEEKAKDEPVKVSMGVRNVGWMETSVPKKDAGKLAFTFLGALIAIIAILIGVRLPRRP